MDQSIQEIIQKIDRLPGHFNVAVKVAKMLDESHDDLDINELTRVISLDQSLTSLLLKLCNSAYYGFSRKIVTIKDAVTKIGFNTIKSIVFTAVSQNYLSQEVSGYGLVQGSLWENSITCAVYSRHLATISKYPDVDVAFTGGLIRDIGKLVLQEYVGANYNDIIDIVNSRNVPFIEAEERVIGINHCQIGAELAKKWNFPHLLVDVIAYHHNLDDALQDENKDKKLISIVHIADSLTTMLGSSIGNDGLMYNFDVKSLDFLNISKQPESIESLISEITDLDVVIDSMVGIVNEN